MPPLLAALLMMEFGCDFRIIEAIDLTEEWRRAVTDMYTMEQNTRFYYDGWLGFDNEGVFTEAKIRTGTYIWPRTCHRERFSNVPIRQY